MNIQVNENIELRQLATDDAQDIFNTINTQRSYLGKWLPFVHSTRMISDTEQFISAVLNSGKEDDKYLFTIRKNNEFAGLIGLKDIDRINMKAEIGYWLSEPNQKKGIMIECVKTLCGYAFNTMKLNRIQIRCAVGNLPSIRIPQKLGFCFEGIERAGEKHADNVFLDIEIYSKLRSDK